jgi:circadian clock protein KaiC
MSEKTIDATGLPMLDAVLGGGLLRGALAVVLGVPGSGKTTLAGQIAFATARDGHKALILTALSEPTSKLVAHLRSFTFFDDELLVERVQVLSLQQALPNGLKATGDEIVNMVRHFGARLVVVDGFQGMRETEAELGQSAGRQFLYRLGTTLSALSIMTLVTSEADPRDPSLFPEMTTADAILGLHYGVQGVRHQRGFEVIKSRGAASIGGVHAFAIDDAGVHIIPRLEAMTAASIPEGNTLRAGIRTNMEKPPQREAPSHERVSLGVRGLDDVLHGGVYRGTQTLVAGPVGSGKTLMALSCAHTGITAGEHVVFASLGALRADLAFLLEPYAMGRAIMTAWQAGGPLTLIDSPAIAIDADAVAQMLLARVDAVAAQRLVVDGVEALEDALARDGDPHRHAAYFTAWRTALRQRGVTALFTRQVDGDAPSWDGPSRSMGDTVLRVRRAPTPALSVVMQRFGETDARWHALSLAAPVGPTSGADVPAAQG